ncbi:hypothetical protein HZC32_03795, partial [Candidatus Woesearchaeota archaeon]|nr:hypothetical protein [Candidatus Woesearchaeota archaeon]
MVENKEERKRSKVKVKKKFWYKIIAPKVFANKEVGESYLSEPENAIGRIIKVNLRDLTNNIKDQNNYVILQISKVSGSQLSSVLLGYELNQVGVKRAVRKNTKRLDDYFEFRTKGGKEVVVKTLMVTLNKVQRSKCALLRKRLGEMLGAEISKSDFNILVVNLVYQKIQSTIRRQLNKIYPLRELA